MIDAATIETRLQQRMPGVQIVIDDPRGDGAYLIVHVSSAQFTGLTLLERQRAVYKAIGEKILDAPPVLSLRTYTPDAPS